MRLLFLLPLLLVVTACNFSAQSTLDHPRPRLVIAIVVDQMRNDFIYRYWDRFGDDGFRRLIRDGFYFRNAHFNYIPTHTAPGHASIFTGTTPRHHGIIANDWFDRESGRERYCVFDDKMKPAGTTSESGKMSPRNMLSSTVTDELRLATSKRGKVYAVALKDRAAVLPAGHMANGAFWLEEESGRFVSSSFYMNELPAWVKEFNDQKRVQHYLAQPWYPLYPIETYTSSIADDNDYEKPLGGKEKPVFPYNLSAHLKENNLSVVRMTPYGNTLTRELAARAIEAEGLGADEFTDLISISFSSPDIIGHAYGPRSVEIEDTYLRLDREIAELLKVADAMAGKDNYVVFLTADHGTSDVASHMAGEKMVAGYVYEKHVMKELREYCQRAYQDSMLVRAVSNEQVFLDHKRLQQRKLELSRISEELCRKITKIRGVAAAYPASMMEPQHAGNEPLHLLSNGYNQRMSGDIAWLNGPAFFDYSTRGTTHGSGYTYDTHVPVIFYGQGIRTGESFEYTTITQIAPTIAELIRCARPSASTAEPLNARIAK